MVTASSFCFLIASIISISCSSIGDKNRSPDLYDQRQTGGYNIRLNLRDVHIIALLGGDYNNDDYEYDYEIPSDYTDFPVPTTTHSSPSNSSSTLAPAVTIKPKPSSSTTTKTSTTNKTRVTTKAPSISSSLPNLTTSLTNVTKAPTVSEKSTTSKPSLTTTLKTSSTSNPSEKPNKTLTYSYQTGLSGDRIPVIVLQQNEGASKSAMISSHVTILPEEHVSEETERVEALGEIHYKKCPNGYMRDKNGVCRKLRRPPLFDFSRFTSSLASKFRRPQVVSPSRTSEQESK